MTDINVWVQQEVQGSNFGDKRLNNRFANLLNAFSITPNNSIPGTCKSWGETIAAYRFFNNTNVTQEKILASHIEATMERIREQEVVLIPQDTTEINFSDRQKIDGMGYLGKESSQGFYLHPGIAITPEGLHLGIVDFQTWTRTELGKSKDSNYKPIEAKESYCWIKGYEAANKIALASPNTTVVSIADREGDIYELLTQIPSESNKAYFLIRSTRNRKTCGTTTDCQEKLHDLVKKEKPISTLEFKLPAGKIYSRSIIKERGARSPRTVIQEIRIATTNLSVPYRKDKNLSSVPITIIHCVELNPPSEDEKLEWFLLTSYPVNDAESAKMIIDWYLHRWQIETFFKTLKTGCTIEDLQFENLKATSNCIALYSIVSWRILYLTMLGRICPDIKCDAVFETLEWQSVYSIVHKKKASPQNIPTLNQMIIMIATLGGFLNRKSDGYPGPKVMWIGLQRMKDFTLAWQTLKEISEKPT
jgi:hypothetical protein